MKLRAFTMAGAALAALTGFAPDAAAQNAPYCREFTRNVVIGGKWQPGYGTACMQPDGAWETQPTTQQVNQITIQPYPTPAYYPPRRMVYVDPAPYYYHPYPAYPAYRGPNISLDFIFHDHDRGRRWKHGGGGHGHGHGHHRGHGHGGRHGHGGWRH